MNRRAFNFRAAACRLDCRRRYGQIRRRSRGRIRNRHFPAFFDVVDDRFRQAQLARGGLVNHFVAIFSYAERDNAPAVLEDNRIRMRPRPSK